MSAAEDAVPHLLCEFFEIAIHNILYRRGIYPKSIFVQTKAYGLPVYQLVHPKIKEYISESLKTALFHLKNKTLNKIILNINVNKVLLERYVMIILEVNEHLITDLYEFLERVFKKFCLKIESVIESLTSVPKDANFNIKLEVNNHGVILFNNKPEDAHSSWCVEDLDTDLCEVLPVHLFDSEQVRIHLLIERNADELQCIY